MSKSLQINFIWFFLFFSSELKLWSFWYSKLLGNYRWMMLIDFSVLPRRLLKHKFYHFSWFNLTLKLNYPSWETLYIHLHKLARSYEVSLKCVAGVVAGVDVVDEVVVDVIRIRGCCRMTVRSPPVPVTSGFLSITSLLRKLESSLTPTFAAEGIFSSFEGFCRCRKIVFEFTTSSLGVVSSIRWGLKLKK